MNIETVIFCFSYIRATLLRTPVLLHNPTQPSEYPYKGGPTQWVGYPKKPTGYPTQSAQPSSKYYCSSHTPKFWLDAINYGRTWEHWLSLPLDRLLINPISVICNGMTSTILQPLAQANSMSCQSNLSKPIKMNSLPISLLGKGR